MPADQNSSLDGGRELSTTTPAPRKFAKMVLTAGWMYGGRGVGLLWMLAIIGQLSVSDYGLYGLAFAVTSIVGPPLDNPFSVRAARESEERYRADRTTRYLLGLGLMLAGLALLEVSYIAWFGLFAAGGEMIYKVSQSGAFRAGDTERVYRIDTIQRVSGVALASAYLFGHGNPTLHVASLLYCVPYAVMAVAVGFTALRHRPGFPGPPRLFAMLVGETLGLAAYLQGDVILLGWLTDSTTVGYYKIAAMVAVSLVSLGQSFGTSYHEALRAADGNVSAGPPLRNSVLLGAGTGTLVLVTGIVLLFTSASTELAVTMMVMSVFTAMRTVSSVFQVVLYTQRRDLLRLNTNLGLVPVKLALVAALASVGAVGAAIATVLTDAVLLGIYATAVYRKGKS